MVAEPSSATAKLSAPATGMSLTDVTVSVQVAGVEVAPWSSTATKPIVDVPQASGSGR